ncbi:MAG: Fic family protein [Peptoanaerobacter stomatis]|uniref:Fic family protein n=1 Tax=Peptoanaerobacter stomatis TaxID=796937 RepID=UPI003FA0A658
MNDIISKIKSMKNELKSLRPLNEDEIQRLKKDFIIENTYNSNAIEGNTITLNETTFIINEGITIGGKSINEHLDIIGHKEAFEYILDLSKEKSKNIDEYTIKTIHSLVYTGNVMNKGVYRTIPVKVGSHTPVQPYLVQKKMEDLIYNYNNSDEDILRKITVFHLEFETIHPFIDGNGRTGRLILNLELIKNGFLPIDIKFTDRLKYYNSFLQFQKENKIDDMLSLILDYEYKQLVKYISILNNSNNQKNLNEYNKFDNSIYGIENSDTKYDIYKDENIDDEELIR